MPDLEFTIKCKMKDRWVPHFLGLLKEMEHLGNIGASREVSIYADLVKAAKAPRESASAIDNKKIAGLGSRGAVSDFSRRSRKRMLEKLAMLRDASGGYFVTLTYPGRWMWTPADCKRHLHNFSKALLRRFPGSGAFWRMELKPRLSGESEGELVPHFHLLIFGVTSPSLAYLRRWISVSWSRIVAYPDSVPTKVRTQCDEITSRKHASRYASKYAAKEADGTLVLFQSENSETWGRHWGTFGTLDLAEVMRVNLNQRQLINFKRLVRSWLRSKGSRYAKRLSNIRQDFGFSAFGLGDLSNELVGDLFEATITRMLFAATMA